MPSGAGLNVWQASMLSFGTATGVVASPLTAYGTIPPQILDGQGFPHAGVGNDSGWYVIPRGLTKVTFQLIGAGANTAGASVSVYGTSDPQIYRALMYNNGLNGFGGSVQGGSAYQFQTILSPASSAVLLPGPSEQSGTGAIANPMTSGVSTMFQASGAYQAFRVVLTTNAATQGAAIEVTAMAVP